MDCVRRDVGVGDGEDGFVGCVEVEVEDEARAVFASVGRVGCRTPWSRRERQLLLTAR